MNKDRFEKIILQDFKLAAEEFKLTPEQEFYFEGRLPAIIGKAYEIGKQSQQKALIDEILERLPKKSIGWKRTEQEPTEDEKTYYEGRDQAIEELSTILKEKRGS